MAGVSISNLQKYRKGINRTSLQYLAYLFRKKARVTKNELSLKTWQFVLFFFLVSFYPFTQELHGNDINFVHVYSEISLVNSTHNSEAWFTSII